jgi:hypothetical protein
LKRANLTRFKATTMIDEVLIHANTLPTSRLRTRFLFHCRPSNFLRHSD